MRPEPSDTPLPGCPASGNRGKVVSITTLRSLIKPEERHRIVAGRYHFCSDQDCDVVYFAADGSHVFGKADLLVRVGVKEKDAPRPICYCFHHTIEGIFAEIQRTGSTGVPEDIRSRLNAGGCDCERTNPQGSCCLGVVMSVVADGMRRYAPKAGGLAESKRSDEGGLG